MLKKLESTFLLSVLVLGMINASGNILDLGNSNPLAINGLAFAQEAEDDTNEDTEDATNEDTEDATNEDTDRETRDTDEEERDTDETRDEDDDERETDESEREIEISVKIEGNVAQIKVEINDEESEFRVEFDDRGDIIQKIIDETGLTEEQILRVIEFEIEEQEQESDRIEIEVKIDDAGIVHVDVDIGDREMEFSIRDFTDRSDIIEKIIEETGLTREQVLAAIEFSTDVDRLEAARADGMVRICHIPPGNPDKAHTITVSRAALEAHLNHGDVIGSCENDFDSKLSERELRIAERLAERDARLADRQLEREARLAEKQAERDAVLTERLVDKEARLAEKEQDALQRAEQLIQRLEQRIAQLEQRLQHLMEKVESGEYFGPVVGDERATTTYSISFEGTASSIFDESVTADVSGQIFLETLGSLEDTSKMRITGGEIFVGENVHDLVFGKTRISPSDDAMIVLGQVVDFESNANTIRLSLDFDGSIVDPTEPVALEIVPRSGISGQWQISGTGQLEQTEA